MPPPIVTSTKGMTQASSPGSRELVSVQFRSQLVDHGSPMNLQSSKGFGSSANFQSSKGFSTLNSVTPKSRTRSVRGDDLRSSNFNNYKGFQKAKKAPTLLRDIIKDESLPAAKGGKWSVPEVDAACHMIRNLSTAELELLASFDSPPHCVNMVMQAVQFLLGEKDLSWNSVRRELMVDLEVGRKIKEKTSAEFATALALSAQDLTLTQEKVYPKLIRPAAPARLVAKLLSLSPLSHDPKEVLASLHEWTSSNEFSGDLVGQWSKAARALCLWVKSVELHFKEEKRKPARGQIEKAIQHGNTQLASCYNARVDRILPQVSKQTGKSGGTKDYDDLVTSRNVYMRQIFSKRSQEALYVDLDDDKVSGEYVKEVDLRASHQHFRQGMEGESIGRREVPRLVALCKFKHKAFNTDAAGVKSWERFNNVNPWAVSFQDQEPRPLTAERRAKHSQDLENLYQSDVLTRKLWKAIEYQDQDGIRQMVMAGAEVEDWRDEKGRSALEAAKEKRLFTSVHVLERILLERGVDPHKPVPKKPKVTKLPKIEITRPPSFQIKTRTPMRIKTYRRFAAPDWVPTYRLDDPDESDSDDSQAAEEQEEHLTPAERKRLNIMKFMNDFKPPLTPPISSLPRVGSAMGLRPRTGKGLQEQVIAEGQGAEGAEGSGAEGAADSEGEGAIAEGPDGAEGVQELGADEAEGLEAEGDSDPEAKGHRTEEYFLNLKRTSMEKKKHLFSIYQGGTSKGGIDDPSISSCEHEYLRICDEMHILPRPLAFGASDPQELNLRQFGINSKNGKALGLALKGIQSVTSLDLAENQLGAEGLSAICSALQGAGWLRKLNLSFTKIKTHVEPVVELLNGNAGITVLDLEGNEISDKNLDKIVTTANQCGHVRELLIARNSAGSLTSKSIIDIVMDSRMEALNLSWMGLGGKFMSALSEVLYMNSFLTRIELNHNGIDDDAVMGLAKCMLEALNFGCSMAIEEIGLQFNRIRERGAIALTHAVYEVGTQLKLKAINLDGNSIGEAGLRGCFHSMEKSDVAWSLKKCSPESPPAEYFERGQLEKNYALDLSVHYDHLVAQEVVKIINERFEGKDCLTKVYLDQKPIKTPEDPDSISDEGVMEFIFTGPYKSFGANYLTSIKGTGALLDLGSEETDDSDLPERLKGKLQVHLPNDLVREPHVIEDLRCEEVKLKFLEVETAQASEWGAEEEPRHTYRFSIDKEKFVICSVLRGLETLLLDSSKLSVEEFEAEGVEGPGADELVLRLSAPQLISFEKDQEVPVSMPYLLVTESGLAQAFEPSEEGQESGNLKITCWYKEEIPLPGIGDEQLNRILSTIASLEKVLDEEKLLIFLRAIAKDYSLTIDQVLQVLEMFPLIPQETVISSLLDPSERTELKKRLRLKTKEKADRAAKVVESMKWQGAEGPGGQGAEEPGGSGLQRLGILELVSPMAEGAEGLRAKGIGTMVSNPGSARSSKAKSVGSIKSSHSRDGYFEENSCWFLAKFLGAEVTGAEEPGSAGAGAEGLKSSGVGGFEISPSASLPSKDATSIMYQVAEGKAAFKVVSFNPSTLSLRLTLESLPLDGQTYRLTELLEVGEYFELEFHGG